VRYDKEVTKTKKTKFNGDRRRKHQHWQTTIYYADGEKFARIYINRERAKRFAERQKKSPIVTRTRVIQIE